MAMPDNDARPLATGSIVSDIGKSASRRAWASTEAEDVLRLAGDPFLLHAFLNPVTGELQGCCAVAPPLSGLEQIGSDQLPAVVAGAPYGNCKLAAHCDHLALAPVTFVPSEDDVRLAIGAAQVAPPGDAATLFSRGIALASGLLRKLSGD